MVTRYHLIKTDQAGATRPTNREELQDVTRWLIEELGLPQEEVDTTGVVIRVPTFSQSVEAPEPDLLNSFFVEDLAHVRAEFAAKNFGRALSDYLMVSALPERRDIVRDSTLLRESVSPGRLPLARWPPEGRYPLVLMQCVIRPRRTPDPVMADTLGAKRRKQGDYSTDCPSWFKAEYSLRMDSGDRSSMRWAAWTSRSKIASATRPPPRYSCQSLTGSCAVTTVAPLP